MTSQSFHELARHNMIYRQVRPWSVLDAGVLAVLEEVPRERFVPDRFRNLAYSDLQIPLGHGEVMMEPRLEARTLQELDPQPGERALEIGTGSGFLTACLARLCARVTSVDLYADFQQHARAALDELTTRDRVQLIQGDAASGWADGQHYDIIAVTGSLPQLHEGFHGSLTIGGRLFVLAGAGPIQEALCITRMGPNAWSTQSVVDAALPPLHNAPRESPRQP